MGPVIKNPNASLYPALTHSGYSSDPKTNRIRKVEHEGTTSNSRIQQSYWASGSSVCNWGSLQNEPFCELQKVPPVPFKVFTLPVVKTIPDGIPIFVVEPFVNVPYAEDGQEIVALLTVKPPPIIDATIEFAVPPWLEIKSCESDDLEQNKIKV